MPKLKDSLTETAYDSILIIYDKLIKYSYFVPYLKTLKLEQIVLIFIKTIFANYSIPETIISDKGITFTSTFWKSLINLLSTKTKYLTLFHPKTDG